MKEQTIQKSIIRLLEQEYNAYTVKVITASKRGVPDILATIEGRFIGIEVKLPQSRNNISKLQQHNLSLIEAAGGIAMVAWDTEMVKEILDESL